MEYCEDFKNKIISFIKNSIENPGEKTNKRIGELILNEIFIHLGKSIDSKIQQEDVGHSLIEILKKIKEEIGKEEFENFKPIILYSSAFNLYKYFLKKKEISSGMSDELYFKNCNHKDFSYESGNTWCEKKSDLDDKNPDVFSQDVFSQIEEFLKEFSQEKKSEANLIIESTENITTSKCATPK